MTKSSNTEGAEVLMPRPEISGMRKKKKKLGFHSTFNSKNATFTRMKEIRETKDINYRKWASNMHAMNL